MKYLKSYKLFESNEYNPSVDVNIIESAKDIVLEYLDDGLEMEYAVEYQSGSNDPVELLSGKYSHKESKERVNKTKYPFDEENVYYSFYFNKDGEYEDYTEINKQVNETLSEIHPGVDFESDRWSRHGKIQALRKHLMNENEMFSEDSIYNITKGYKFYGITDTYEYEGMEFISCTEDVAYKVAEEIVKSWEEQEIINVGLYFRFDCIDEDSLAESLVDEDYFRENWKDYGIKEDDDGEMDEDNFDNFIQSEKEMIKDDLQRHLEMHFGKEGTYKAIKNYLKDDYINTLTENIVSLDGLGHTISSYDGEEHIVEYNNMEYSIFRLN